MNSKIFREAIEKINNGTFFSMSFASPTRLNAESTHKGVKVRHLVTETVRTGVNYENLKIIKELRDGGMGYRPTNYTSLVKNKMQENPKNGHQYGVFVRNSTRRDEYEVTENGQTYFTDLEGIAKFLTASEYNRRKEENLGYHILNIENITSISQKGVTVQ